MQKFKLTHQELAIISIAMSTGGDGQVRRFPKTLWKIVGSIAGKIQPLYRDNALPPGKYEIELSGDEKKLIIENVNGGNWTWIDCPIAEAVIEKLSLKENDKPTKKK